MAGTATEKTNFTIKMDRATRDDFDLLCDNIGISMSAGINALVKQAIREQGMTFSVRDSNGLTPYEAAELKRRANDAAEGNIIEHELIEE